MLQASRCLDRYQYRESRGAQGNRAQDRRWGFSTGTGDVALQVDLEQ